MIAAEDGRHLAGSFPATQRAESHEMLRASSYDSREDSQDPNFFLRAPNRRKRRSAQSLASGSAKRSPAKSNLPGSPVPPAQASAKTPPPPVQPHEPNEDLEHRSVSEEREDDSMLPPSSFARAFAKEKKDATWWKRLNLNIPTRLIMMN